MTDFKPGDRYVIGPDPYWIMQGDSRDYDLVSDQVGKIVTISQERGALPGNALVHLPGGALLYIAPECLTAVTS